jgi:exosortase
MTTACDPPRQADIGRGDPHPRSSLDPAAIVGIAVLLALIALSYAGTIEHLVRRWSREADYSHGFLVPLFSAWLLWRRRDMAPSAAAPVTGRWLGALVLLGSALLRVAGEYYSFVLTDSVSLIACLLGATMLIGGWGALRWAWPSIVFLLFMVPLPGFLATRMSGPLQRIATISSTYALQTLGVPAIASGNVIWLSDGTIGVAEACSGLRMLIMFGAVTMALVLLLDLGTAERLFLLASSVGIAVVANVFRITTTGMVHEWISPRIAEAIFHDVAGWIMMPLALILLGFEIALIARLFPPVAAQPVVLSRQPRRAMATGRAR